MSSTLRVTDGTTTVTLSSGDFYIVEYQPQVAQDFSQPLKERCRVRHKGTVAGARTDYASLNRLLYQAEAYHRTLTGPRVYVEFDPGDTGDVYRSLVYSAKAQPMPSLIGPDWYNANIGMEMEWTRQPFWEGPLAQIPLTNTSATDDTSGITITNSNYSNTGGSAENWVSIDAEDVLGDLPGPIKLEMTNSKNGADDSNEILVFHNVFSDPANFPHVLEAEDATGATVTPAADATCSDGSKATLAWAAATETLIAEWSLSAALLGYASGGQFAVVARFADLFPYDDCWLRLKLLTTTDYYTLHTGELAKASNIASGRELKVLDTLRLPPYLEGETALRALALRLYGLCDATAPSFALDYLMLCPISGDAGYLQFLSKAAGVPYNTKFVHDGCEGKTYRIDGSNNLIGEFTRLGGPLLLTPNRDQKLYFLTSDYNGYAKTDQTWTVKLWHRPRRSSI